ncbi:D-aminoacyl-tRNA deacylase 2-like isoform X2 [Panulirus ornatus]|uniref:D-aminoacyl-tRNA deacylase 2-like isoform X2 n=1 Tax=Panulirus ornatus TaxID=150431 RepID=UPI003A84206E
MSEITGRVVIQQCLSACLKLPGAEGREPETVEVGRGIVVFVCFLDKATEETVEKLTKHVINVRLSENDDGRHVSICDIQGDVLIIPQATLGGKLKGSELEGKHKCLVSPRLVDASTH